MLAPVLLVQALPAAGFRFVVFPRVAVHADQRHAQDVRALAVLVLVPALAVFVLELVDAFLVFAAPEYARVTDRSSVVDLYPGFVDSPMVA